MSCLKRMQLEHQPLTGRPEICSDTSSTRTTDRRSGVEQVKLGFATFVFERKLEKGLFGLNVLDANMYMACMDTQYWSATNRILLAHFFRTNHLTLTVLMIGAMRLIFGQKYQAQIVRIRMLALVAQLLGNITANTLQAARNPDCFPAVEEEAHPPGRGGRGLRCASSVRQVCAPSPSPGPEPSPPIFPHRCRKRKRNRWPAVQFFSDTKN